MKEVIMPVIILHPKNFQNFQPTWDSDGLFFDIELVRESISESDAETIQESAKFLT